MALPLHAPIILRSLTVDGQVLARDAMLHDISLYDIKHENPWKLPYDEQGMLGEVAFPVRPTPLAYKLLSCTFVLPLREVDGVTTILHSVGASLALATWQVDIDRLPIEHTFAAYCTGYTLTPTAALDSVKLCLKLHLPTTA
jgi:hypothetical protein